MEVTELEEGEARFDNNDSNIDLDKALSYIDTRLQNVLGHFQRDFEGFVSAETLGPKHGDYGSFLPTHKHPPTAHSHSKPPQNALNTNKPPSFNNFHSKAASSNSVTPASQHRGVYVDQNALSANDSTSKDTSKNETTTSNLGIPNKQRLLKLRIKVGSDKITRKKYELYTPSSSTGNDPEESGGPPIDSPSSILRDMTSIFVPENRLLSPLNESLLCLPKTVRKTESVDSKWGLTNDLKVKPSSNSVKCPGVMLNADVSTSKANETAKKLIPVKKRETKRDLIKDQLFGPDFSSEEESEVVKHVKDCQVDPKETTREPQEVEVPNNIDKFLSERKNKLMGVQSSSLSGPMKEKKGALKDIVKVRDSYKDILDTRVDQNKQTKPSDMFTGNEAIKEKNVERIGIPAEVAVPQITEVGPPVPPDNWVGCDRCGKWRLLPIGIEPDNLPDKWLCSMLTWLPGRNRCDVSEEETTKAVQDMNLRLISQNQHSVQANIGHSDLTNLNVVSENMANRLLKNKFRPECSNSSMIESSHSSMNAREKKRKSFSEANQPLVEKNVVNKPVTVKVNGKDVNGGDVRTKKLKSKTVSNQYETVHLNKMKTKSDSEQVYVSNGDHLPRDKLVISVKRETDSKLLDKKVEMPAKKRKLKDWEESQPSEDMLESSEDKLGRKEKRLKTEVNDSTDVKPLNIGKTMKIRLSSASKENSVNTSHKVLSAATSSSSKVSGSCTRDASLQERKGSPVGSVSLFPIRPTNLHKISPAAGKTISRKSQSQSQSRSQSFADKAEVKHTTTIPQSSGKGSLSRSKDKDEKINIQRVKIKTSDPSTDNKELFPNKMRKIENTRSESKLGDMGSSEVNPTVKIRDLKVLEPKMEDSFNQNAKRLVPDCGTMKDLSVTSFLKEYASSQTAMSAFKRAEESKDYADRLKMSGFDYECNDAYFDSALKFLYTASLLESSSITDFSKSKGVDLINGYSISTKLSKICAQEYEKRKEMAAATLAYKCIEVACMRIVYYKSLVTRQDLQTMQMVNQGESPSSSASDVDNLNNHASIDKTILSKSIGNQVVARNHANFSKLLDFTSDVNLAMEACMKSQNAYKAANAILEETTNKEMIVLVKRVVDFSFQDVKELVCLVQNAREAINRQGFKGGNNNRQ